MEPKSFKEFLKEAEDFKKVSGAELDRKVKAYLIDAIDPSAYDSDASTDAEKVQFFYDTFTSEYDHEIKRRGEVGGLREYLMGLPTIISIPFYNSDIIELAKEWGSIAPDASEREEDKIVDNYFNFMANKLSQLFTKYKVRS